jgi:flagellar biosynthesis/type III secretory pathway protein FliH
MKMQQMIERLLAVREHMKEVIESQIGSLVTRMEADRKSDREEMTLK